MSVADVAHILKKKEGILSLEKCLGRKVSVCSGLREIHGTLKGFDNNASIVLADATMWEKDVLIRSIGACVIRGGNVVAVFSGETSYLQQSPF